MYQNVYNISPNVSYESIKHHYYYTTITFTKTWADSFENKFKNLFLMLFEVATTASCSFNGENG